MSNFPPPTAPFKATRDLAILGVLALDKGLETGKTSLAETGAAFDSYAALALMLRRYRPLPTVHRTGHTSPTHDTLSWGILPARITVQFPETAHKNTAYVVESRELVFPSLIAGQDPVEAGLQVEEGEERGVLTVECAVRGSRDTIPIALRYTPGASTLSKYLDNPSAVFANRQLIHLVPITDNAGHVIATVPVQAGALLLFNLVFSAVEASQKTTMDFKGRGGAPSAAVFRSLHGITMLLCADSLTLQREKLIPGMDDHSVQLVLHHCHIDHVKTCIDFCTRLLDVNLHTAPEAAKNPERGRVAHSYATWWEDKHRQSLTGEQRGVLGEDMLWAVGRLEEILESRHDTRTPAPSLTRPSASRTSSRHF